MIPTFLSPLANHLWQSTLFAGVAGLLTVALHKNHARVRHAVWLAASCKFLVPFSLLNALGGLSRWSTVPETVLSNLSVMMDQVSRPFPTSAVASPVVLAKPSAAASPLPAVLLGIWACGFLGIACSWWVRWWRIRAAVGAGSLLQLEIPIRAVSTPTLLEPGVFGVFQPVLLLPEGIFDRLTPTQLKAIIAHELCHVRHRDNLIAAIHMLVETVFWFHPLVWWIGKRMVEERELACDQEVLRTMSDPKIYAEGILNVCKFYLARPVVCVSGVAGSDLRKRIEAIMANRITHSLTFGRKLMLAVVTTAAVAVPIIVGIDNVPLGRAQSQAANLEAPQAAAFDVASVRPAAIWKAGGEGSKRSRIEYSPTSLSMWNVDLTDCVQWAYVMKFYQVSGPGFLN
jgi:bla regulator protein blaR1